MRAAAFLGWAACARLWAQPPLAPSVRRPVAQVAEPDRDSPICFQLEKNCRTQPVKSGSRNTAGSMKRLKAAFFNSIETPRVDSQIGQDGEIFDPSPS